MAQAPCYALLRAGERDERGVLDVDEREPLPKTTSLLLSALRDEGHPQGWNDFTARYWPVLVGLGMHLGLREADAHDAAQWTLLDFVRAYRTGAYERGRGRLRSYVLGIARNRIRALRRAGSRGALPLHDPDEDEALSEQHMADAWESQRNDAILRESLERLRASPRLARATLEAFELVALRGVPAEEAARQTGMSIEDVYLSRHRCTKRLRELVEETTRAWDEEA